MHKKNDKEIITSLIKGLNVIKSFDSQNTNMILTDVAKKTQMTKASARRILLTLKHLGYVQQSNNFFSLTPKIIDLGYSYFASLPWTDLAYENIKQVVDVCKLSCSISILDDIHIVCIMRIPATRILNESINVGTKLPVAYTATGRVFMMHMSDEDLHQYISKLPLEKYTNTSITNANELYEKIKNEKKTHDYQLVINELENGFASIAVPIYDSEYKVIGAVNVASYLSYKSATFLKHKVLPLLKDAAKKTSESIQLLHHRKP